MCSSDLGRRSRGMRRVRGSTAIQTDYNRSVSATKRSRPARQLVVRPEGLEPPTLWSEARCSNPLSYGRLLADPTEPRTTPSRMSCWSGREDLNLRPRRPERRALPSCATPRLETPAWYIIATEETAPRRILPTRGHRVLGPIQGLAPGPDRNQSRR